MCLLFKLQIYLSLRYLDIAVQQHCDLSAAIDLWICASGFSQQSDLLCVVIMQR